jgi:spore cortex formation protein SpoVR/YcgB (stage V sporulation)
MKLFTVLDDDKNIELEITAIHDDKGYRHVRQMLSNQYNLSNREPNIQVYNVNRRGDRSLTLRHTQYNRQPLDEATTKEVLKHVARLWGFTVRMETLYEDNNAEQTHECIVETN